MTGVQALANAIVLQAVKDYRRVLSILFRNSKNKEALSMKRGLEQFFHSQWFAILTDLDPEELISKLNAEVKQK